MSDYPQEHQEAPNLLLRLLQLSKLAREAESAAALQFLLVNQLLHHRQVCPQSWCRQLHALFFKLA